MVLSSLLTTLGLGIANGVMALAGAGIVKFGAWLAARTHNEKVQAVIATVDTLAARVVAETYQAYVAPIKAAGTWNAVTAGVAKTSALASLKAYLGPKGINDVLSLLGGGTTPVDKILTTFLEAAVAAWGTPAVAPAAAPVVTAK